MELSTKHQQKRRPSDSNTDYMTYKDNGKESHPQAGHKMSEIQATHVRHAGHSVAMFRDKFWLSFALTIPVVFWSTDVQHWLGYTAPTFPGSKFIPPILGTVVFVYGGLVFIRGAWGELADRKPGMMTLISLGIIAAFGTSLAATFGFLNIDVWWELTSLITIMLLGHWLEMRAISQALESRGLAPGTVNLRLAAIRRLAYEAADCGLLSPEQAAGIRRVKGAKKLGVRVGNWLLANEARALCELPDAKTLKGKRDRAILSLLLACGLRRGEVAALELDDIQRREDHWAIVDLTGKGGHVRTVPVPDWVSQTIAEWVTAAGISSGKLFRCVCRAGKTWGELMTDRVVWHVVKDHAARLGLSQLAPHDLRRSCARLCHVAGGELEQIQFLLGHVSVQTTEKYLGCKQRIRNAVNDRIGIEPSS